MYEFKDKNKFELTNSKGTLHLEKDGEFLHILFEKNDIALSIAGSVIVSDFIWWYEWASNLDEGLIVNDGNIIGSLGMKQLVIQKRTVGIYLVFKTISKTYIWNGDTADNEALSRFVKGMCNAGPFSEYPRTNKPIPIMAPEEKGAVEDICLTEAIYIEALSKKYVTKLKECDSSNPNVLNAIQSASELIEILNIKTKLVNKEE